MQRSSEAALARRAAGWALIWIALCVPIVRGQVQVSSDAGGVGVAPADTNAAVGAVGVAPADTDAAVGVAPAVSDSAEQRIVPVLVGLSAKEARAALAAAGLVVRFQLGDPAPSKDRELTVYAVEPRTGASVSAGGAVQITVYSTTSTTGASVAAATGSAVQPAAVQPGLVQPTAVQPSLTAVTPLPTPPVATVGAVPNAIGLASPQAKLALSAAGFRPRFRLGVGPDDEARQFTVYSQDPGPGLRPTGTQEVELLIHGRFGTPTALDAELVAAAAVPYLDEYTQDVDPESGRLRYEITDLSVPAGALQIQVLRSFCPAPDRVGLLGSRWRCNWECRVDQSGSEAFVTEGADRIRFTLDEATEQYVSEVDGHLEFGPQQTVWTRSDGRRRTFDEQGRLIACDERNGNSLTVHYDEQGRLQRVAGPYGAELRFTVDARGRLTQVASSQGARVQYSYSASDPLPDGAGLPASQYSYSARGSLVSASAPYLGEVRLEYDAAGRITYRRWSDGVEERFVYDQNGGTRYVDPLQQVTVLSWDREARLERATTLLGDAVAVRTDEDGRPVEVTGPTGLATRLGYDNLGRTVTIDSPLHGTTRLEYLGETRLATSIVGPGTQQSFEYDAQGNLTRLIDGLDPSRSASFEYFGDGQISRLTLADGQERRFTYDSAGRLATVADAAGNLWRFEYDERGNLVRDTAPDGGVTSRIFDPHNLLTSVTDPDGGITKYERTQEGARRTVRITDPQGGVTTSVYNSRGRLVSTTDPANRTTRYEYDVAGRLVRVTDPEGRGYQYQFDTLGQLVGEVGPAGQVTRRTFDALGRVTSIVDPDGRTVRFEYTPAGLVSRIIDATGRPIVCSYDGSGRLTSMVSSHSATTFERSPSGAVTRVLPSSREPQTIEYDSLGQVTQIRQGDRVLVAYEYNALSRRAREIVSGGPTLEYRYDGLGQLQTLQRDGRRIWVETDGQGRPGAARDDEGAATRLACYPDGSLLAATDPRGRISQAFQTANRLIQIQTAGQTPRTDYDAAGQYAGHSPADGARADFYFDPVQNCLCAVDAASGDIRATYAPTGQLLSVSDLSGQTVWLRDQPQDEPPLSPLEEILQRATPAPGAARTPWSSSAVPGRCVCQYVGWELEGVAGFGDGAWRPRRWLLPRWQRVSEGFPLDDVDEIPDADGWETPDDFGDELDVLGPPGAAALTALLNVLRQAGGLTAADRQRAAAAVAMASNRARAQRLEDAAEARRRAAAAAAAAAEAERQRQLQAAQNWNNGGGFYQDDWGYYDHDWEYDDWGGQQDWIYGHDWEDDWGGGDWGGGWGDH